MYVMFPITLWLLTDASAALCGGHARALGAQYEDSSPSGPDSSLSGRISMST